MKSRYTARILPACMVAATLGACSSPHSSASNGCTGDSGGLNVPSATMTAGEPAPALSVYVGEVFVVTVQSARGNDVTAPAEDGTKLLCVAKTASAPGRRTTTFRATALGSTTLTSSDSFSSGDLSRDVYSLSVAVVPSS